MKASGTRLYILVISLILCDVQATGKAPVEPHEAVLQMSQPGPHEVTLISQCGDWDVVATMWPAPNASPLKTSGLIAHRTMIGSYQQEILQPAPGAHVPDFRRLDFLNFDHVEGRWKYVSMDTRFPVSIMPARSNGLVSPGSNFADARISMEFEPQAFVGLGAAVEGRFMLSDMTIISADANHMVKEQRVNMANGSADSWLFVRYEYVRRASDHRQSPTPPGSF